MNEVGHSRTKFYPNNIFVKLTVDSMVSLVALTTLVILANIVVARKIAFHGYATPTKQCTFFHHARPYLVVHRRSQCDLQYGYRHIPQCLYESQQPFGIEEEESQLVAKKGSASIPNLTTSLVKSIVGAGVLALPAGVTNLGDSIEQALPTALVFIAIAGWMNAYFFSIVGRVCAATGAVSYRDAWDRSVGRLYPNSTITTSIVTWTVTFKTALSCLAYSMILADSFQSLAVSAGFLDCQRSAALLFITISALLPLCLRRDLSSLAPFSLAGLFGFGVAVTTMVTRCWDGTYNINANGQFLSDLPIENQPSFGTSSTLFPKEQGIILLCTLATAFVAHYNAPRFHAELRDNNLERFNLVVGTSFAIAALLFAVVAVSGFLTFGSHSQPFILNNYSPYDPFAVVSRLAVAISILLTFPLPFVGLRDGILDSMNISDGDRNDTTLFVVTLLLLSFITVAALLIHDLSFVLAVGGGTFSTAVSSVFPTLMFVSLKQQQRNTFSTSRAGIGEGDIGLNRMESIFAFIIMTFSIFIGVTGVFISLNNLSL
jgi:amino acid permease